MGEYLRIFKMLNLSSLFLLPLLKISEEKLTMFGFTNTYLDDIGAPETYSYDVLFVLFQPNDLLAFQEFVSSQYNKNSLVADYDYEGGFVVLVYRLPEEFKADYELFYQSKYSKFSEEFKKQFPVKVDLTKVVGYRHEVLSTQWAIFKRDKTLINELKEECGMDIDDNTELCSSIDTTKEVLCIEDLINK